MGRKSKAQLAEETIIKETKNSEIIETKVERIKPIETVVIPEKIAPSPRYEMIKNIKHNGKEYFKGDIVDLNIDDEKSFIHNGFVKIV